MQRNYKLIISIIALALSSLFAFTQEGVKEVKQEVVEFKDVFLDGKPAKLNMATGEIKLVYPEVKNETKPVAESTFTQPKSSSVYNDKSSDFHIVKENESLLYLSKRYGVTLNQLKKANNLESTLISKGQTLRVRNFDSALEATSNPTTENSTEINGTYTYDKYTESSHNNSETYPKPNNVTSTSKFHIVSSGETLYSLAKRYGLTLSELKNLNNLSSNLIRPNQKLRVSSFAKSEEENNTSNATYWIVQSGDNLYRIALNNGTTVEDIKRLNGLTSNLITVGQKLKLR